MRERFRLTVGVRSSRRRLTRKVRCRRRDEGPRAASGLRRRPALAPGGDEKRMPAPAPAPSSASSGGTVGGAQLLRTLLLVLVPVLLLLREGARVSFRRNGERGESSGLDNQLFSSPTWSLTVETFETTGVIIVCFFLFSSSSSPAG